mmetsp:Transcript_94941/g.306524  ORF Transcript_94941/g.306524 Transcript_94941/m.306524 type:complete len:335 (-) Transcript_94941:265-1269(-)
MLHVVAQAELALLHEPQVPLAAGGEVQEPQLAGLRGAAVGDEEPPTGRLACGEVEELVLLGVEAHVAGLGLPHDVAPELPGPLGGVLGGVEDSGAVSAPLDAAADPLQLVRQLAPGRQVEEADAVGLVAREVHGVGQLVMGRGWPHPDDHALALAFCHLVLVEHHLLLGVLGWLPHLWASCGLAAVDLVRQALHRAGVVEPWAMAVCRAVVGLLEVQDVLGVDLLPQLLQVRRLLLRVGVLGPQVRQDLLALPLVVPEPEPWVLALDRRGHGLGPAALALHGPEGHLVRPLRRHRRGQRALRFACCRHQALQPLPAWPSPKKASANTAASDQPM